MQFPYSPLIDRVVFLTYWIGRLLSTDELINSSTLSATEKKKLLTTQRAKGLVLPNGTAIRDQGMVCTDAYWWLFFMSYVQRRSDATSCSVPNVAGWMHTFRLVPATEWVCVPLAGPRAVRTAQVGCLHMLLSAMYAIILWWRSCVQLQKRLWWCASKNNCIGCKEAN
jgi:hypothetical protein